MPIPLTVSDLRQYTYCARVLYFTHCLGRSRQRPTTYKMQEGLLAHDHVADLEEHRSLKSYGLTTGQREFDVYLYSETLGLSGRLDMAIITPDEVIPVEFKNMAMPAVPDNYALQLAGYGLLLEEKWQRPVRRAFVHSIPARKSVELPLDDALRQKATQTLARIRQMIVGEQLPGPARVRGRCRDCEFRPLCPDVWEE